MGDFQIYHKGILASSSGVYSSYGNYHFFNYLTRTSAHNCLTVRDPAVESLGRRHMYPEGEADILNDGGTKMFSPVHDHSREPDLVKAWERDFRMAKVLSHTESDERVELVGDLTEAYAETCERVVRSMTFEPMAGACGVFTVSDEVVAKSPEYVKEFHLHMMEEPIVEGNTITIEHQGGRLVCTVLEPENAEIKVVGGGEMRFTLNGKPIPSEKTDHRECGWGQVILTPRDAKKEHHFKVRMEIFDAEL